MLVEDDERSAIYMTSALNHLGCEVTRATDGADAASAATGTRFDLILMDYKMPLVDGAHATVLIRNHETAQGLPHVPVIAVTASMRTEELLQAGMDGVLLKPVSLETLRGALLQWLPTHPKGDAPPQAFKSGDP